MVLFFRKIQKRVYSSWLAEEQASCKNKYNCLEDRGSLQGIYIGGSSCKEKHGGGDSSGMEKTMITEGRVMVDSKIEFKKAM